MMVKASQHAGHIFEVIIFCKIRENNTIYLFFIVIIGLVVSLAEINIAKKVRKSN